MTPATTRALVALAATTAACARPATHPATRDQGRVPSAESQVPNAGLDAALASITGDDLLRHIRVLASDRFEGRAPATRGEDSTVAYLEGEFRRMGLAPGNPDGTYIQQVPMVGTTSQASLTLKAGGRTTALRTPEDFVAWSYRATPDVRVDSSQLVFVGYGVVAPELGWDDYKGADVRGKTVVFLVGDPPIPDPNDPARLDTTKFRGPAMTYYGRWTYKYEIAAEKGAAAALIIHETGSAGYAWTVPAANAGRERFDIPSARGAREHIAVEGWLHLDRAKELLQGTGQDFAMLKDAARRPDFRPVPLAGATATFAVRNTQRQVRSRNVVARIVGSDQRLRDEYVVNSAHWDHLGRDTTLRGDQIYNGAVDNASGVAWLLETAEAYTKLGRAPKRSVLFLAVTAEEQGLLGAKYYGTNPLYPLKQTLANINLDIFNQWGRTRAIVSTGHGQTTMDEILMEEAARQGRTVKPDPEPEKGYYYRSDHFEFAKQGVPALTFLFPGTDYRDRPPEYGQQKREGYVARDYHKPSDEVKPDWDLAGAVEDTQLLLRVGLRIADGDRWPEWKPGTEFRARREAMMR
jgi:Zn-dependent M28 family amino/carboxypeptidase